MPYLARDGKVYRQEARDYGVRPVFLLCALAAVIALTLHLLHPNYKTIIGGLLSSLKAIGMAIWTMLCDAAHACAAFVNYIKEFR
jgi:hypothetical protein